MKDQNIVKLDRTTVQEFLPMLTHRGVFSNYESLPKKDEIIEEEKKRLGINQLTLEQERAVLSKVGKYRSNAYVVRDYGDYVIAFSAKMYLDNLNKTELELKDEVLKETYSKEKIQEALKKVNTYKLTHKIAILILGEVYNQRKHEGVKISKKMLVEKLGYTSEQKYIYSDLREAVFSLRWLDYIIYNYNTKLKLKEDRKTTGNFIYNLSETSTEFTFWVNPLFVGCALHMANDGSKLSDTQKKELFGRGYLEYPLDYIRNSRNISDGAYFLGNFLITQKGNSKLSTSETKVVTIKFSKLLEQSRIEHTRSNVRVNKSLNALAELTFIQQIKPPIEELRQKNSKRVEEETLHIYIPQQKKVILKVQK